MFDLRSLCVVGLHGDVNDVHRAGAKSSPKQTTFIVIVIAVTLKSFAPLWRSSEKPMVSHARTAAQRREQRKRSECSVRWALLQDGGTSASRVAPSHAMMRVVADLLDSKREEGKGSVGPKPKHSEAAAADKSDSKGAAVAEMHEDASTSPGVYKAVETTGLVLEIKGAAEAPDVCESDTETVGSKSVEIEGTVGKSCSSWYDNLRPGMQHLMRQRTSNCMRRPRLLARPMPRRTHQRKKEMFCSMRSLRLH